MVHETHRISSEPREAPPSSRGVVKERERDSGGGPPGPSLAGSRPSLAPGLEEAWRCSVGSQAHAGKALETDREAAGEAPKAAARGGDGVGLSQRVVDVEAHRQPGPQGVRGSLPPEPPLACPPGVRVELPSARTARHPARRRGHRALDAAQVAGNKKKPENLAPTSPSSMRSVSCSSRRA